MTLKELRSQVSYLGFETELTDTEAFILAAERALRQIYLDHPSVATAVIPTPMPRIITVYDRILHRATEEEIIPLSGRALTFRASGVGKYCIREGNESYEVPFSGRSVTVRRALREGAELILRGEYDFTVYGLATYASALGGDREDIPEYGRARAYDLSLYIKDFGSAHTAPRDGRGRHIQGASIDGSTLLIPFLYDGEVTVSYRRIPSVISRDAEDGPLDIPEQISHLLPLLTASYLWLDEDDEKAIHYLTLYRDQMATARRYIAAVTDSSYDTNGWA